MIESAAAFVAPRIVLGGAQVDLLEASKIWVVHGFPFCGQEEARGLMALRGWQIATDPSNSERNQLRAAFNRPPMLPYYLLMELPAVRNPPQTILLDRCLHESELAAHLAIFRHRAMETADADSQIDHQIKPWPITQKLILIRLN